MSEKRFYELVSSIDYYQIWDKQEDKGYTIEDAVDKLNSLVEENEQLRECYKDCKKMLSEAIDENELLECKEGVYNVHHLKKDYENLKKENEQLKKTLTKTEEEKEHYADLYNECRRLKLSNEAIRKAYAELNRKEREKHSQGNATYTRKSDLEVMY